MNRPFEWDVQKAAVNIKKHGVTFEEAITIFNDHHAVFKKMKSIPSMKIGGLFLGYREKGGCLLR